MREFPHDAACLSYLSGALATPKTANTRSARQAGEATIETCKGEGVRRDALGGALPGIDRESDQSLVFEPCARRVTTSRRRSVRDEAAARSPLRRAARPYRRPMLPPQTARQRERYGAAGLPPGRPLPGGRHSVPPAGARRRKMHPPGGCLRPSVKSHARHPSTRRPYTGVPLFRRGHCRGVAQAKAPPSRRH